MINFRSNKQKYTLEGMYKLNQNFGLEYDMEDVEAYLEEQINFFSSQQFDSTYDYAKGNRVKEDYIERVIVNNFFEEMLRHCFTYDTYISSVEKIGADKNGIQLDGNKDSFTEPDFLVTMLDGTQYYLEVQCTNLIYSTIPTKKHKIHNTDRYNNYYILFIDTLNNLYAVIDPCFVKANCPLVSLKNMDNKLGYKVPVIHNKFTLDKDCFYPIIAIENKEFANKKAQLLA